LDYKQRFEQKKVSENMHNKKQHNYFLSHSVGLPFAGVEEHFSDHYFEHWFEKDEPWPHWLEGINEFRTQLAKLINADIDEICPQSNLSSGLTKLIYSLPKPAPNKNIILCSAEDFPSMAFVLKQAECLGYSLKFIPEKTDLHDISNWQSALNDDVAICLITHVQSNNGHQLPVAKILEACRSNDTLTIVDVAQSIGLFEIDTKAWQADFILGSCVKWLCGGPGAGFLWVNNKMLKKCEPVDVGWFSHDNPFEFDVRNFKYAETALRFWGGTPTVAPYIHAGFAISKVNSIGVSKLRGLNYNYLRQIHVAVANINDEYIKSPTDEEKCSGTVILHFGEQQEQFVECLTKADIAFDQRPHGVRLSPHCYTTSVEMDNLIACIDSLA
jgi:kynureninase